MCFDLLQCNMVIFGFRLYYVNMVYDVCDDRPLPSLGEVWPAVRFSRADNTG